MHIVYQNIFIYIYKIINYCLTRHFIVVTQVFLMYDVKWAVKSLLNFHY